MIVGFTGTRAGMTAAQRRAVASLLNELGCATAIHGGCLGADMGFDGLVNSVSSVAVLVFPSNLKRWQGEWCPLDIVLPEKSPLERNCDIVNASDVVIACPRGFDEQLRSGTWHAIRYVSRCHKPLVVVWPDGGTRRFDYHQC